MEQKIRKNHLRTDPTLRNLLIPDRKRSPHTLATISPTKSKSSCTLLLLTLPFVLWCDYATALSYYYWIMNMLPACRIIFLSDHLRQNIYLVWKRVYLSFTKKDLLRISCISIKNLSFSHYDVIINLMPVGIDHKIIKLIDFTCNLWVKIIFNIFYVLSLLFFQKISYYFVVLFIRKINCIICVPFRRWHKLYLNS